MNQEISCAIAELVRHIEKHVRDEIERGKPKFDVVNVDGVDGRIGVRNMLTGKIEFIIDRANFGVAHVSPASPVDIKTKVENREPEGAGPGVFTQYVRVRDGLLCYVTRWYKNGDHPNDNVVSRWHTHAKGDEPEGWIVRRFRDPDNPGTSICKKCGDPFGVHGWIDNPRFGKGTTVCPGDYVITEAGMPATRSWPMNPRDFNRYFAMRLSPIGVSIMAIDSADISTLRASIRSALARLQSMNSTMQCILRVISIRGLLDFEDQRVADAARRIKGLVEEETKP